MRNSQISTAVMVIFYSTAIILDIFTERGPLLAYGLIVDVLMGFLTCYNVQTYSVDEYYSCLKFGVCLLDWSLVYDFAWLIAYCVFAAEKDDSFGLYVTCCVLLVLAMMFKLLSTRKVNNRLNEAYTETLRQTSGLPVQNQPQSQPSAPYDHQLVLPQVAIQTIPQKKSSQDDLPPSYEDVINNDFASSDF